MKSGAQMTIDRVAAITKGVGSLVARDVLVGIPQTKAPREGDRMNNATIGYIMENGSAAANIPARPWLVPGVRDARAEVASELGGAAKAALSGQVGAIGSSLERAGLVAQNAVRAKINSGDFTPLSDATLKARARRGKRGSKGARAELDSRTAGNAPSTEFAKPLIDSGQLRNSISYVVR